MITRGEPKGWLPFLFFGLCAIVFLVQLHPRATSLTVTADGLEVCSLFRKSFIRWETVSEFGVYALKNHGLTTNRFVGLNFHPSAAKPARMRAFNKNLVGFEDGLPDTYGWKAQVLADYLNFHLARHAETTSKELQS